MSDSLIAPTIGALNEKFAATEVKYRFTEDGKGIFVETGEGVPPFQIHRMAHDSKTIMTDADEYFNRTVKRDSTILVSGDRPRFALLVHQAQPTLCPDITKIGDCRIGIEREGQFAWIDRADRIRTTFYPGYTDYQIDLTKEKDPLGLDCRIYQIGNQGGGVCLRIRNTAQEAIKLNVVFEYGGVMTVSRTFHAEYFKPEPRITEGNRVHSEGYFAEVTTEGISQKATVASVPRAQPVLSDNCVRLEIPLLIKGGSSELCSLAAILSDQAAPIQEVTDALDKTDPEACIAECTAYYDRLIGGIGMKTPHALLDTAFTQALYNLDYDYTSPAWLEGVHWWGAPWCNNYQISAGLSIHQLDRVKKALMFFASPKEGPCATMHSDHSPEITRMMNSNDGLPYYLYELTEYYFATGDQDLIREIWDKLVVSVDRIMKDLDAKGNHLLGWHMGCNAFLYQADHLQLPGEGASPSIMLAGMLDRLSGMALSLGEEETAGRWSALSEKMFRLIMDVLWNPEQGVFYSHEDMENIKHMSHYYTDMVFPVLYSDYPDEVKWQSLEYLNRTLWVKDIFETERLLRVGDYKPTIFGSDNVMPVQMAEAARAYQKAGDYDRGIRLLEGVALAGTLFTEAPGNFPERMSDLGKGEANYVFGNPIGSFLYTMVDGLMGAAIEDEGKTLRVQPGIPWDWDFADFSLPYVKISYQKRTEDRVVVQAYSVENTAQEQLRFSVFVAPGHSLRVTHNNIPVDVELLPALNATRLSICVKNKHRNSIVIEYIPVPVIYEGERLFGKNRAYRLSFNQEIESVSDPNGICARLDVEGVNISVVTGGREGKAVLYVKLRDIPAVIPIRAEVRKNIDQKALSLTYHSAKRRLSATLRAQAIHPVTDARFSVGIIGLKSEKESSLPLLGSDPRQITFIWDNVDPMPEGVYEIISEMSGADGETDCIRQRIDLTGEDSLSTEIIRSLRDQTLESIDLSAFLNSREIYAMTRWRTDVKMIYYVEQLPGGKIQTPYGPFWIRQDTPNYMCLLRKGSSNRVTGVPVDAEGITEVEIPIGRKVRNVALFFASEAESRHTFGVVGKYELIYDDTTIVSIPMEVGVNIDTLFSHFATDTVEVKQPEAVWKGNSWDVDSMNAYRIPCDPSKTLKAIRIGIDPLDVNIGIMALNITPGE